MEENLSPVKNVESNKLAIFFAKNTPQRVRKQGWPCDFYEGEHPVLGKCDVCRVGMPYWRLRSLITATDHCSNYGTRDVIVKVAFNQY